MNLRHSRTGLGDEFKAQCCGVNLRHGLGIPGTRLGIAGTMLGNPRQRAGIPGTLLGIPGTRLGNLRHRAGGWIQGTGLEDKS